MMRHSARATDILIIVWKHRQLIWQMTKREVLGRYRGSILGLFWSFFQPVFMLCVYTFVFSVVFQAKWGMAASESKTEFAIILFAGLIVFNLFAEVINRAPDMILQNVSYVKKVVFPLEILPIVTAGSAIFHAFVSVAVLLMFNIIVNKSFQLTALLFPVVISPLLLLMLGLSWILASLGVFLRDVGQTIGILTTALLFMSPVFFPTSALPESLRWYLMFNPLAFIIEQTRQTLVWGGCLDWFGLGMYSMVAMMIAWLGLAWFQKTRKGFSDVL